MGDWCSLGNRKTSVLRRYLDLFYEIQRVFAICNTNHHNMPLCVCEPPLPTNHANPLFNFSQPLLTPTSNLCTFNRESAIYETYRRDLSEAVQHFSLPTLFLWLFYSLEPVACHHALGTGTASTTTTNHAHPHPRQRYSEEPLRERQWHRHAIRTVPYLRLQPFCPPAFTIIIINPWRA